MIYFNKYFGLIILLLLSYLAVRPFFISGFFSVHDDTQVSRVFEMAKALKDGMFPVRWVQDLGYGFGYPIFNFYAPLAYYIGALFVLLGFDALVATKLMMGIGIILAGASMYFLAREFFGEIGGVVSGLFYLYAPYHAVDIYVRGDVAELFSYAFIPLAFYGLFMLYRYQKWRFVIIGSLGQAGIILSHNLTAMMVTPFILIAILLYCYIAYKKRNVLCIKYYVLSIILGLGLSAFYWLPALWEMDYTNVLSQIGGGADFRDHFVCIQQLWESQWGFGGSTHGCVDGFSFILGKVHIGGVFLAIVFLSMIIIKKNKKQNLLFVFLACVGFFISVFLTLDVSKTIWEILPFMAFIQYPWRFLILAAFFSSFVIGFLPFLVQKLLEKKKYSIIGNVLVVLFFVIASFVIYGKYFNPQTILPKSSEDYITAKKLRWDISKISDEYLPSDFDKPNNADKSASERITIEDQSASIELIAEKTHYVKAIISSVNNTKANFNIAYFPSWRVYVSGKETAISKTKNSFTVPVPSGEHTLEARFVSTPVEKLGNALSLSGVAFVIAGIIYKKKRTI